MKKVLIIMALVMAAPVMATEMCARNDTVVVALDAAVAGTGTGSNNIEYIWWTLFPYGRIYGLSTCLSAAEGGKPSGGQGSYINSDGQMLPQDEALAGRTGQDEDGNDRGYCWCKMTHPASSRWVFHLSYSALNCASSCAANCGVRARDNAALRSGLFGSVGK